MNQNSIPSVLNPSERCYCRVDGWYESSNLVFSFGQYDTYGDGTTKHSPAYRIGAAQFTDFCLSVAKFILANPDEPVRAYEFGLNAVNREVYDFLRTVKYDESKRRWYSLELRKVTASDSKRHDKRFSEVPSWADGSPKSAYDLFWSCRQYHGSLMERYAILQQFREFSGYSFYNDDECEKWKEQLSGDHMQAFRALEQAVRSAEARDYAQRLINSAIYNSTPKADSAAA